MVFVEEIGHSRLLPFVCSAFFQDAISALTRRPDPLIRRRRQAFDCPCVVRYFTSWMQEPG